MFLGVVAGGYDPGFHMGRIHTLATNIGAGHFPNPIGFEFLNKFGYGVGFFYGNFLIYPFALLNLWGVSLYHSYLLYLIFFIIVSIVSINYATHKLFHNSWATILSAPIYLTANYFIGIVYFRAAAGELLAMAIMPWILLSVFKLVQGKTKYWLMLSISLSLLLVSHILSFLIAVVTVILIVLMNCKPVFTNKKILISFVKSAGMFIGLTAVFLLPFVEQYLSQKYVSTARDASGNYGIVTNSIWLQQHIFDPTKSLSVNGTLLAIYIIFIVAFYLIKNRGFHFKNKVIPQATVIVVLYSFFMYFTDPLQLAVKIFKPLVLLQVITRVEVVVLPLVAMLVANALGTIIKDWKKFSMPVVTILIAGLAILSIAYPIKSNISFADEHKREIPTLSVSMGEYEPRAYMDYNEANNYLVTPQFLEKVQNVKITQNNRNKAVVKLDGKQTTNTIMLPRLNYKGYQMKLNYNGKTVTKPAIAKNGFASVKLPSDFKRGTIEVSYHITTLAKVGWIVTILTVGLLGWIMFKPKKYAHSVTK